MWYPTPVPPPTSNINAPPPPPQSSHPPIICSNNAMIMISLAQMRHSNGCGSVRNDEIYNLHLGYGAGPLVRIPCSLQDTSHYSLLENILQPIYVTFLQNIYETTKITFDNYLNSNHFKFLMLMLLKTFSAYIIF